MNHAVIAWGRFNPPTEEGHGKLVKAVQDHAEKVGGQHYIFPTHTQDKKKNPMTHEEKVGAMKKLFPSANVVSHDKVKTIIDAMKHLESKGHKEVTVVAGSDRVSGYHDMLSKYREKEYPGIKKVHVVSAGHRDPDAEGAEGMSASKLRGLVAAGKKNEFISHYSDKKLGAHIHDRVKAGMQMESVTPKCIFLLGGPGCGKDYIINNIFSRFDLTEVQYEQIASGKASTLVENKQNLFVHGINEFSMIEEVKQLLEGYDFDHIFVSVTNKVSRLRNAQRGQPLNEQRRIDKFLKAEKLAESIDSVFKFNNSINLSESSELERVFFADQIQKLLERLTEFGLVIQESAEPKILAEKKFPPVAKDKKTGLPKKYVAGLSASTAEARKEHWRKMAKFSDRDSRAYKPAPGDATAKTKPSKHTLAVRKMMKEGVAEQIRKHPAVAEYSNEKNTFGDIKHVIKLKPGYWHKDSKQTTLKPGSYNDAKSMLKNVELTPRQVNANRMQSAMQKSIAHRETGHRMLQVRKHIQNEEIDSIDEGAADSSLAAKAAKSGISVSTLRKVYNRGVAAWNSGHRPGTTPQQWGHARVNSYINKGKTYHTADKDLREASPPITKTPAELSAEKSKKADPQVRMHHRWLHHYNKEIHGLAKEEAEVDTDINKLFEMQLVGTDEYRKHAIAMTPGQTQEIEDVTPCSCGGNCKCSDDVKEAVVGPVDTKPTLTKNVPKFKKFRKQVLPGNLSAGTSAVAPPIFIGSVGAMTEEVSVEEAVKYHLENNISLTENVFRPGSEKFFEVINEAKKLFKEGKYEPKDEYEEDLLNSDVGQYAAYEGTMVPLDFPFEEEPEEASLNEDDPTGGKGIGKPWREGGGGAVYVKVGDSVRKISFSKSGMAKKYNDPAATRSFVARHHCLTNKDKTSASYWACRWPRFFSNSGKAWW